MAFYNTDLLYVQRPSSKGNPHFQMDGFQLRDFVEETQLSVNTGVIDDLNSLKIRVSILEGDIIRIDSEIATLNIELDQEKRTRELEDLIIKTDIDAIKIRLDILEDYSDIRGFYYLQPPGSTIEEGGMAFNNVTDDQITNFKLHRKDYRDQVFTYTNINPGEKIEITHKDSNGSIRKRLLFNIEEVVPPITGIRDYVELKVTYLFSSGDKTLEELSDEKAEFIADIFPAFDPQATVTKEYVDNQIETLDNKLTIDIQEVAKDAGVSQIIPGDGISITPSNGLGAVTITATVEPPSYNLPTASTSTLGGVKISALTGSIANNIIGIDGNTSKLTIQQSTNQRVGVNYKGQCAIYNNNNAPNPDQYTSGTLVWNRTRGQLYIMT
jgi:hypothetical protein